MRLSGKCLLALCSIALIGLTACYEAFPAVEGKFERTLSVSGPVDLDVATGSGRIEVRVGSSSVVQVHGFIRARDDWHANAQEKVRYLENNPPVEQSGNVIRIGRIENEDYRNNVSISYEITVPTETRLHSRTGSGSQRIDGIRGPANAGTGSGSINMSQIGGDASARTGSGSIELDMIAGRVDASTGSGSIRAERIGGGVKADTGSGSVMLELTQAERGGVRDVEVSTGSGRVEVMGVDGSLSVSTGSGSIVASGNPGGSWKLRASSGGVTVRLRPDAAFDLYAYSGSRRITINHPLTVMGTVSPHEMQGKVRGGGNPINIRTSSGSITIQ